MDPSDSYHGPRLWNQSTRKQRFWIPFTLTTSALVCMALIAAALFAALEVAYHTLTPIQHGAGVNLTTSDPLCLLAISDVYNNNWTCPVDSSFADWGGFCCCANCTDSQTPFLFANWSDIPGLPPFSQHEANSTSSNIGPTFHRSAIWALVSFGPTLIAVIHSMLWNTIDVNIKKLHPFMEMLRADTSHQVSGTSICFTYLDKNTFLVPFYAFWRRHHLVLLASSLDVTATILISLLATCFELQTFQVSVDGGLVFGRSPALNRAMARVTQAVIVCMILAIICLIRLLRKRPHAVYSDPTSLASIMAMAHPSVLDTFRHIETSLSTKLTLEELNEKLLLFKPNFSLRHVTDELSGTMRYQIVVNTEAAEPIQETTEISKRNKFIKWLFSLNSMSVPSLIFLAVIIVVLFFFSLIVLGADSNPNVSGQFNEWTFRFTTFGYVTVAVIQKTLWVAVERDTRLHEPLRRLSSRRAVKRGVSASSTLLPPFESNLITVMYRSIRRKSFFLFLFATAGLLAEINTIVISVIASQSALVYLQNDGTTFLLPNNSQGLNDTQDLLGALWFTITATLVISFLFLVVYRISAPRIPKGRGIKTVADTLRLICGSHCVQDFAQASMLEEKEKKETVLGLGKKYAFGIVRGVDGVDRWAIDDVSLVRRDETRRRWWRLGRKSRQEPRYTVIHRV